MILTLPMQRFVDYLSDLGPRWGIAATTSRVHALLYLSDVPLHARDIAETLALAPATVDAALNDLSQWRMGQQQTDGGWSTSGEPLDLLFTSMQERRRREMQPALQTLTRCQAEMSAESGTPTVARERIESLLQLVRDLAAIDLQASRVTTMSLARMVSFGSRAARLFDRIFPKAKEAPHD